MSSRPAPDDCSNGKRRDVSNKGANTLTAREYLERSKIIIIIIILRGET